MFVVLVQQVPTGVKQMATRKSTKRVKGDGKVSPKTGKMAATYDENKESLSGFPALRLGQRREYIKQESSKSHVKIRMRTDKVLVFDDEFLVFNLLTKRMIKLPRPQCKRIGIDVFIMPKGLCKQKPSIRWAIIKDDHALYAPIFNSSIDFSKRTSTHALQVSSSQPRENGFIIANTSQREYERSRIRHKFSHF